MTKTERWLNPIALLLDLRLPVTREEILSQVSDYKEDWNPGDPKRRESTRRKFERDKSELRELGVTLAMHKVIPPHEDQEVEAYLLRPKDFYLPYLSVRSAGGPRSGAAGRPYYLPEVALEPDELSVLRRAAQRVAQLEDTPLGGAARSALGRRSFDLPEAGAGEEERGILRTNPPTMTRQSTYQRGA